jgi:hypothetical protein
MNIPVYYIWFKGWHPEKMIIDMPHAPQYPPKNPDGTDPEGPIIRLFVRSCKDVTGVEPPETLELFKEGLNHPFNEEAIGLTKEEMMERFDYLMALEPSAVEVVAAKRQSDLIYNERFKPTDN